MVKIKISLLLGLVFALILATTIYLSINTIIQIKNNNFTKANQIATKTLFIIDPLSKITFNKISDLELLKYSFYLIRDIPTYNQNILTISKLNTNDNYILDLNNLLNIFKKINNQAQTINNLTNKSFIIKKFINKKYLNTLNQISENISDFIIVLKNITSKNQKIIIIFQNSDEIRATGGFMGSYAILNIENGKITEINTEDIYDADGQFNGFIEAPTGVKKYLSEGKGLRLPDANWYPDFPTSAKHIMQFFALGNRKNITTLVTINPDYVRLLLDITGDVYLKDYDTTVNSSNINEVLRSKRDTFFPGSIQKKHLLSQLITQLQIKFTNLNEETKLNILKQTFNQLKIKNIQLYSKINKVDEIFSKYGFRQELKYMDNADYLYLVESNVGVNKANKNITRNVELNRDEINNLIIINFKNNNLPYSKSALTNLVGKDISNENKINHLGYVNYQRIIVKPEWKIDYIKYNNNPIILWNENIITNSMGEKFKEIGFLVTLKEQSSSRLEVNFINNLQNKNTIYIQKQPGLPATPYTINNKEKITQILLENNFLFKSE